LNNCMLADADLSGSDLNNISGHPLDLSGVDLRGTTFNNLDPRKIDLTGVRLGMTQGLQILDILDMILDPDAD
jgi:uncharacterized protein YjbI with pentapeptide repeats